MLIAKGRPAQIRIEVRNYDGVLAAATGNVAVVVKDIDETTVASGNAAAGSPAGSYTFDLPNAVTGNLGVYEATITYTLSGSTVTRVETVETVGDYLFEIHELRAKDRNLENTTNYPAEELRKAREKATVDIEEAAQVAFAPRARRVIMSGNGTRHLMLPDVRIIEVAAVSVFEEDTGTDDEDQITGSELVDIEFNAETGVLARTDGQAFPIGSNNILIDYVHGYQTAPAPIREAALTLAVDHLVTSNVPIRATSQSSDLAEFRISVANEDLDRPTGIPNVDTAIKRYGYRRPSTGAAFSDEPFNQPMVRRY